MGEYDPAFGASKDRERSLSEVMLLSDLDELFQAYANTIGLHHRPPVDHVEVTVLVLAGRLQKASLGSSKDLYVSLLRTLPSRHAQGQRTMLSFGYTKSSSPDAYIIQAGAEGIACVGSDLRRQYLEIDEIDTVRDILKATDWSEELSHDKTAELDALVAEVEPDWSPFAGGI